MRRMIAFILCFALLLLSSITHGRSEETSTKFRFAERGNSVVKDENKAIALSLPKAKGSWLVEISRSGGMRPIKEKVQINSVGEINVISERFSNGRNVVDCSRKEKISTRDLLKVKAAITSSKPTAWETRYSDPAHPICCDQPTTELKLEWRVDKGEEQTYSTSWYPGSYNLVPTDIKALETFIQPLWNAASDRCNK